MQIKHNKQHFDSFAVIILAAGESRRMGKIKALLPFDDHAVFLEKIVQAYVDTGITNITLVINETLNHIISKSKVKNLEKICIFVNKQPNLGRTHSIQLGLKNYNNKNIFIQNIDNPFVTGNLLNGLIKKIDKNTYVNPYYKSKGGHPILISKEIAIDLRSADKQPLNKLLKDYKKIKYCVDDKNILKNINTPEDYTRAIGKF